MFFYRPIDALNHTFIAIAWWTAFIFWMKPSSNFILFGFVFFCVYVWVRLKRRITCRINAEPAPFMLLLLMKSKQKIRFNSKIGNILCLLSRWHFGKTATFSKSHRKKGQICALVLMNDTNTFFEQDKKKIADINLCVERERKCFCLY